MIVTEHCISRFAERIMNGADHESAREPAYRAARLAERVTRYNKGTNILQYQGIRFVERRRGDGERIITTCYRM